MTQVDISYPPETEAFRAEVKAFLADRPARRLDGHRRPRRGGRLAFARDWRRRLAERGYLSLTWPEQYGGRGLSKLHQVVLMEELALAGVPFGLPQDTFGVKMLANTLLRWGTEEQKRHFLPRILAARTPGARATRSRTRARTWPRSATRAVLDGESGSSTARRCGPPAPTTATGSSSWPAPTPTPRSTGASPSSSSRCDQPGVEVRPFRMMSGQLHFNEVFFNGARTRADLVVGGVDNGWTVAQSLLGVERGRGGRDQPHPVQGRGGPARRPRPRVRQGPGPGRSGSGSPGAGPRSRSCATSATGCSPAGSRARSPAPSRRSPSCTGASTTPRSPTWRWTSWACTARSPVGRPAAADVPHRRPRRRELLGVLVDDVPDRPLRHDLRRDVAGAAEHPRGEGAGPAARAAAVIRPRCPYPSHPF